MLLGGYIYTPTSNGNPAHNLCGQGHTIVSQTGLDFKLGISKDGINITNLVYETNLGANAAHSPNTVYTYGDVDIIYSSFGSDSTYGFWYCNLEIYKHGTTQKLTTNFINVHISINKTGYSSFNNVFQTYGYDIGNISQMSRSGNPNLNIYLINTTDYNTLGQQQNAYTNGTILTRPFTKEIYTYCTVGTQGTITYFDTVTNQSYGQGMSCMVCKDYGITFNISGQIQLSTGDNCIKTWTEVLPIYLPVFTTTSSCSPSCGDGCVVNTSITVNNRIDYTLVTPFNVDNTLCFLTEFLYDNIVLKQYDATGVLQQIQDLVYTITYATWILNPSNWLGFQSFTVTLNGIGDNIIKVDNLLSLLTESGSGIDSGSGFDLEVIIDCTNTLVIPTCDIFTISKSGTCGNYTYKNNTINVQQLSILILNQDGSRSIIVTGIVVTAFQSYNIILNTNGIFIISITIPNIRKDYILYYTIANFCNLETCWNNYLQKVICCPPKNDCETKDNYEFFAFMINAHSFFMLLNDEFNFNYLYKSLQDLEDRTTVLQTMNSFIQRFDEYCISCKEPCLPCQENREHKD